jgi:hypothetical protein
MNERIKQFYEQCNRVVDDPFGGAHISFDHQMFAELIVRECITQVEEESSWPYSSFGKKIKEHFGVK